MTEPETNLPPVRVAIVDDSRSIRRWLRTILEMDPRLEVVAEAGDGEEARNILRQTRVDVITLDVDMPGMTGIEFLSRLMAHRPMPVVMLSALTEEGSSEAIEALSLGAVDCIEKPRSILSQEVTDDIRERVWQAAHTQVTQGAHRVTALRKTSHMANAEPWRGPVILVGASTGGVAALEILLAELDDLAWPIVIAQHMPDNFLRSFARRLNDRFSHRFILAEDELPLQQGQVVMAIGKEQSTRLVRTPDGVIQCQLGPPSDGARYRPCVDDLFHSAALAGLTGAGVLLTGMGSDGAKGLRALRDGGFVTAAQDEQSCVVFGMPKAAIELDAAELVDDPAAIGRFFVQGAKNNATNGRTSA